MPQVVNRRPQSFTISQSWLATALFRSSEIDPAAAMVDDPRLPGAFVEKRLPQTREQLAARRG